MTELIAEIAQAHDGSLGLLHSYIDALAGTGVHTVKFQTHIAAAESSTAEKFRVPFSYVDKTRFDYWKRMEFSLAQWKEIKQHCEEKGMRFLSSPFSIAAVQLLEEIGIERYKIGSGETSNLLMLDRISKTNKPVILSSGMSNWSELDTTVAFLQKRKIDVSILQCTTAYPVPASDWGLQQIKEIRERYKVPVGYSDHSGTPVAGIAAAALDASIIEFHVVFDKNSFGPDARASLTIGEVKFLAKAVEQVQQGMSDSFLKNDNSRFDEIKIMFGKSLAVNKDLDAGAELTIDDLESKKPGDQGIAAGEFEKVIGKKLKQEKKQWEFLQWDDLS